MRGHPPGVARVLRAHRIGALGRFEELLHALPQPPRDRARVLVGGRLHRLADPDGHRDVAAPEVARAPLGPQALGAPQGHRDQRHPCFLGQPCRTRLEALQGEGLRDRRLGEHSDDLAGTQRGQRVLVRVLALLAVDGDVLHAAHQGARDLVPEHRLLGHEPHQALLRQRREPGEDEVQIADVIAHQNRATGLRDVLRTLGVDLQVERLEKRTSGADDRPIDEFCHLEKTLLQRLGRVLPAEVTQP